MQKCPDISTSTDFPVFNAFQARRGGRIEGNSNAFVTRLRADGAAPGYSTYLGGSNSDTGNAIAVDARGSVYVAGAANSTDFPSNSRLSRKVLKMVELVERVSALER